MKTILLVVLLAGAAVVIESCSSSSSSTSPSSSTGSSTYPFMIGKIEVIGNEPFARHALRTDATHVFLLQIPKGREKELGAHQQRLVKLYYSGRRESGTDHYLDVDHIEISENK